MSSGEHDNPENPERQAHEDPCLHSAWQHASWSDAVIGDRSGARSMVGHGSPTLLERKAFLAQRQVAAVEHLWYDVGALLHLEVHDSRLTVDQFVQGR